MKKNNAKDEKDDVELELKHSTSPTSYSDYIQVASNKKDGNLILQLISILPDVLIENHRTVLDSGFIKHFIDILCEIIDYYPQKPKPKKKKRKPAKKK